jgi:hypothetical protein
MKKRLLLLVVVGIIALYALGACDTFLVESGIQINLYDCEINRLTGEASCSGPLAP